MLDVFDKYCFSELNNFFLPIFDVCLFFCLLYFRIQNMNTLPGAVPEYRGSIDVLTKVAKHEGVHSLWKGFTPYFCRLGPHTVITFILMEQLNTAYRTYVLGVSGGSSGL